VQEVPVQPVQEAKALSLAQIEIAWIEKEGA
jgi:hypothetical protein